MSKPNYRVIMSFDAERKLFLARAPELEHCTAEGATRAEALGKVEEEIDAQLANMLSHGTTPPRAVDQESFDGQLSAKISHTMHRDLSYLARTEGVDLNHLIGELLATAFEARKHSRGSRPQQGRAPHEPQDGVGNQRDGGGGGNQRRGGHGGRGGYNPALDDRANFIEYVRGLESSGGQASRPHGGGGNGGNGGGPGGGGDRGRRRRGGGGGGSGGGRPRHDGPRHDGPRHDGPRQAGPGGGGGGGGNGGPRHDRPQGGGQGNEGGPRPEQQAGPQGGHDQE